MALTLNGSDPSGDLGDLLDAKLTIPGAWTSWTPAWSGITLGNSTVVAKYISLGKVVNFKLTLTIGSTASGFGRLVFTLPVAENSGEENFIVNGYFLDLSLSTGYMMAPVIFGGNIYCDTWLANSTYLARTSGSGTVPFAPATGDVLRVSGSYEAA